MQMEQTIRGREMESKDSKLIRHIDNSQRMSVYIK